VGQREHGNGQPERKFCKHRIVSAVKRVGFASDKMLYMFLRGRWVISFF